MSYSSLTNIIQLIALILPANCHTSI